MQWKYAKRSLYTHAVLIKQKEKNEDIRITCAEIAKYNKWKGPRIYHYTARGKNMPVFKNSVIHGESLYIGVYVP